MCNTFSILTQLQDLVESGSTYSGKYFVNHSVVLRARRTAESYLDYASMLVDDFLDSEVALYCTFGSRDGVGGGEDLLAVLPEQTAAVFIGMVTYCTSFGVQ